jgi:hypothetical protein
MVKVISTQMSFWRRLRLRRRGRKLWHIHLAYGARNRKNQADVDGVDAPFIYICAPHSGSLPWQRGMERS